MRVSAGAAKREDSLFWFELKGPMPHTERATPNAFWIKKLREMADYVLFCCR
jgi:hypothetical protein